jgi:hypothetical protein
MHYQVDVDPAHSVIRLTVIEEIVSLECAEGCYQPNNARAHIHFVHVCNAADGDVQLLLTASR